MQEHSSHITAHAKPRFALPAILAVMACMAWYGLAEPAPGTTNTPPKAGAQPAFARGCRSLPGGDWFGCGYPPRRRVAAALCVDAELPRRLSKRIIGLRGGGKYRLSAWCRTERLERPAAINIAALGPQLNSLGAWRLPFPQPGDWREVSAEVVVPAPGAEVLRVMIHVEGPCRLWVDDFQVTEVDAEGAPRPILRDGLPPQHDLYEQWVRLYHGEGRPYLQFGAAIPPPAVEPAGAVRVGAFRAPDGSQAVIAVNAADVPGEATLRRGAESQRVQFMPWEVKLLRR